MTMKELLERWAALAPDEFNEDDLKTISDPETDLERNDVLAKIQYAVQAVIVNRGWKFNLMAFYAGRGYVAEIRNKSVADVNPTKALLSAYLKALEEVR